MSIRRRAICARVERDRRTQEARDTALRVVDDVTTKLRADTYESLFLRSGQLGHYAAGPIIRERIRVDYVPPIEFTPDVLRSPLFGTGA